MSVLKSNVNRCSRRLSVRVNLGVRQKMIPTESGGMQQTPTQYWEQRRPWYNVALVPPTILGYGQSMLFATVGDERYLGDAALFGCFVLAILGANACYSLAYLLELIFGRTSNGSQWQRAGRPFAFILGTLWAMYLAFVGGRVISEIEYYQEVLP